MRTFPVTTTCRTSRFRSLLVLAWLLGLATTSMTTSAHATSRVQEVSDAVLPGQDSTTLELQRIFSGETLSAVLEVPPGTTMPGLILYDYGDKPLTAVPAGGCMTTG